MIRSDGRQTIRSETTEESSESTVEESGETAVEESADSERRYPTRQRRIPQKLNDYIM
jgi:hypothetical protein